MMMTLLQEMISWLHVLVAAGGAVVSGVYLGRSRWAGLLTGAFLAEATTLGVYRVASLLIRSAVVSVSSLGAAYLLASVEGLAARVALVAGVAGVLSELVRASVSTTRERPTA